MKGFILAIATGAIAFLILLQVLPNSMIAFKGDTSQLLLLAVAVGAVNAVIKPAIKALSFPISLLTMGLSGFVINAALLMAVAYVANGWAKLHFTVGGWPAGGLTADTIVGAVVASVLLSLITTAVGLVVRD